jgi:hypothetical protein
LKKEGRFDYDFSQGNSPNQLDFSRDENKINTIDDLVKSFQTDGFVKSSRCKARKN